MHMPMHMCMHMCVCICASVIVSYTHLKSQNVRWGRGGGGGGVDESVK